MHCSEKRRAVVVAIGHWVMPRPDIKSCILIESPTSESDNQFKAHVTELLAGIYGVIPEWLEFRVGRRLWWREAQFREFICIAGSVSAQIIVHASRPKGISRAIILYGRSGDGSLISQQIRGGIETKFDPE